MTNRPLLLVVAAALLDDAGRLLLQRRPTDKQHGGLWEFPGGKVEPGEAPEQALARELGEELGIAVAAESLAPVSFAAAAAGDRHLILLLYAASAWRGEPRALAADDLAWVAPRAARALPMPPADGPLLAALEAWIARSPG